MRKEPGSLSKAGGYTCHSDNIGRVKGHTKYLAQDGWENAEVRPALPKNVAYNTPPPERRRMVEITTNWDYGCHHITSNIDDGCNGCADKRPTIEIQHNRRSTDR